MNRAVNQHAKARRNRLTRIRDFLLYVVAGIGMVTAAVLVADFSTIVPSLLVKWLGFAAMTALVFGDTVRANRRWWRQRRFWLLLCAFFVAQCGLGIVVLWTITKVPTMLWALLIPLDYVALSAYLGFFLEFQRG